MVQICSLSLFFYLCFSLFFSHLLSVSPFSRTINLVFKMLPVNWNAFVQFVSVCSIITKKIVRWNCHYSVVCVSVICRCHLDDYCKSGNTNYLFTPSVDLSFLSKIDFFHTCDDHSAANQSLFRTISFRFSVHSSTKSFFHQIYDFISINCQFNSFSTASKSTHWTHSDSFKSLFFIHAVSFFAHSSRMGRKVAM